jgi:hypothetical protein
METVQITLLVAKSRDGEDSVFEQLMPLVDPHHLRQVAAPFIRSERTPICSRRRHSCMSSRFLISGMTITNEPACASGSLISSWPTRAKANNGSSLCIRLKPMAGQPFQLGSIQVSLNGK